MHHKPYLWLIIFVLFALTCKKSPTGNEKQLVRREMVLFASDRNGGNMNIWMMEKDGSNPRQLTFYPDGDYWPADISPDGRQLLFYRHDARTLKEAIYMMEITGAQPAEDDFLVNRLCIPGNFFPDGQQFAYFQFTWISDSIGHDILYAYNLADNGSTQISPDSVAQWAPQVSPDGKRICYNQNGEINDDSQLAVLDLETNQRQALTPDQQGRHARRGRFIDNHRIIFTANFDVYGYDLFLIDLNTRNMTAIVPEKTEFSDNPFPDTSGAKIYFRHGDGVDPKENSEIYVVNIDGSGFTRLTNNQYRDAAPVVGVVEFLE